MKTNKTGLLSGTALKLIAMVSMVFDHVGDNFFPDMVWMRVLGRIAMPIFFYNGERGKGLKWLFYLFYPGHLLLIFQLRKMLL